MINSHSGTPTAPAVASGAGAVHSLEARRSLDMLRNDTKRPALRAAALWVHRYVGLLMALFLAVAGVTGSVIAFYAEVDRLLSPGLYELRDTGSEITLDPFEQHAALERQLPPGAAARSVELRPPEAGTAAIFFVSRAPDAAPTADDEFFVDPRSGQVLGSRRWGDLSQGACNLVPFLYRLHYSLALDKVGIFLFGVVALLWTIDCFVGAYLTLPLPGRRDGRRGPVTWLSRWKPAWLVRGGQLFSWVFTGHRASGLWLWALLLVFAWSAVGLNLREVYDPVMGTLFGMAEPARSRLPKQDPPRLSPALDFRRAHRKAQLLMAEEARARGFELLGERRIAYEPEVGAYRYHVQSSLDVSDRHASTTIWIDGQTGELLAFEAPTGESAGKTITTWIYQLHFGAVARLGFPYRLFVCALGLIVAALSVTGVWIWWVKRAKRAKHRLGHGPALAGAAPGAGRRVCDLPGL